ncbi:MAG: diaminopimelate decarboxylase [Proteobacteria bacterium]|nr:diaminopimelate decarboxylase [Pseudomonadota bacterium]
MNYFNYRGKDLYCEDVALENLAKEFGTPLYVYSGKTILRHYHAFDNAFKSHDHLICYSIKANSNIGILNLLVQAGSGFDIVSKGELYRAMKAGADPSKIVFSGVGKTEDEIEMALIAGILMFNVESEAELYAIDKVAGRLGKKAPISFRVNPDVNPLTHPYISTGLKKNKFGIPHEKIIEAYKRALDLNNIEVVGIDCHIGSQITQLDPFNEAVEKMLNLIEKIESLGINIKYVDLGGGLGITYKDEEPAHPNEYGEAVLKYFKGINKKLIFEPGRVIVGNAGVLLTKVLYKKDTSEKKFIVVDAAMNDLARPALYGSYHSIVPVIKKEGNNVSVDIVGPVCESTDYLAKERTITEPEGGDLLCVMSAGAYGFSMASNYNSRLKPAEILVYNDKYYCIRERDTLEDLVSKENIPQIKVE